MATSTINLGADIGGRRFAGSVNATVATVAEVQEVTLPAAKPGRLTTRTDNNTGTLTMDAGHGLTTGKIDIFWNGGARWGMDGTVTDNSIAIDGGGGIADNLPPDETDITAVAPTTITIPMVAGTDATVIGADITTPAHCIISLGAEDPFVEGGVIELNDGTWSMGRLWNLDLGLNPLESAGDVTTIKVSQGGTVAASFKLSLGI